MRIAFIDIDFDEIIYEYSLPISPHHLPRPGDLWEAPSSIFYQVKQIAFSRNLKNIYIGVEFIVTGEQTIRKALLKEGKRE